MDLALLEGIGAGFTAWGQRQAAKEKIKLAEQLELEREKRAEEREIAREQRRAEREASTPASYKPELDDQGNMWMRAYNSAGEPLDKRRPASQLEIEDFNRQREKDRLTLEGLVADTKTKTFNAGRLETEATQDDEMHGLRRQQLEASITATRALANQRTASATRTGRDTDEGPVQLSDLAEAMVRKYPNMFDEYDFPHSEKIELARAAMIAAQREGKDPVDVARRAVHDFARRRNRSKRSSTKGRDKPSTKISISN